MRWVWRHHRHRTGAPGLMDFTELGISTQCARGVPKHRGLASGACDAINGAVIDVSRVDSRISSWGRRISCSCRTWSPSCSPGHTGRCCRWLLRPCSWAWGISSRSLRSCRRPCRCPSRTRCSNLRRNSPIRACKVFWQLARIDRGGRITGRSCTPLPDPPAVVQNP